jgi:hypothetical protein
MYFQNPIRPVSWRGQVKGLDSILAIRNSPAREHLLHRVVDAPGANPDG